ncbi:MAG TPA: GNAT family N-acetyltransferase [Pseudonocardiaceae bacterium]|nr:GNAT family N-acetyltransferase [Pseudonocardiaceae bacterium]
MDVTIRRFDANLAPEAELADYYRLMVAIAQAWSGEPPGDYDAVIGSARKKETVFGPTDRWAAYADGTLIGFVTVSLPQEASTHLAVVRVMVHPEQFGRGVGTALLRHVAGEIRAIGRTTIEAWNVPAGKVGEAWAHRRGFATVKTTIQQRLDLAEVDPAGWQVEAPEGYHAVTWSGSAPEELLVSFTEAQNAIHDAPFGEAGFEFPQWTPESVRAAEARLAESGVTQWVVAAVHDADGTVAFTELQLAAGWAKDTAVVNNTAVVERHRGHGLGVFIKARMNAWLRAERPDQTVIVTSVVNDAMVRVNEKTGFRSFLTTVVLNAELDSLRVEPEVGK